MKIAIVGTGISGLVCAYLLHPEHEITVFEANDYVGGHTNTVEVEVGNTTYSVDTGFIVFNDRTYPHFVKLLKRLGVESQPSEMSFSVRCERTGLEYNGTTLNRLFAQRRNLLRPSFYRMLGDILRFNRESLALLDGNDPGPTLGEYLNDRRYSSQFCDHYIVPMGAAIWSADPDAMYRFPARFFVQFFRNHGMLSVNERPIWRVIKGGSRRYVEALTRSFQDRIRLNWPVLSLLRVRDSVQIISRQKATEDTPTEHFDRVIVATHSDQALALLSDATEEEKMILGSIPYQENEAVLHRDASILPHRRLAWASWNYHIPRKSRSRVAVTYHMNTLQRLHAPCEFFVTLNHSEEIHPAEIIRRITYHHPVFTPDAVTAQRRHGEISGRRRTYFCGAYWGYGFHEDGVKSALDVCRHFGKGLDG